MRRVLCLVALAATLPVAAMAGSPAEKARVNQGAPTGENLVTLALRSEARGDAAAREELLKDALEAAPDDPAARWHNGEVLLGNEWVKPADVSARLREDLRMVEYRNIRGDYPDTVEGQWNLAAWCSRKGLQDQKRAHLTKLLEMNPNHAGARRELGFRWVDGVWLSAEERAASNLRAQSAADSLNDWSAKLIKLRDAMERRSLRHQEIARERLMEIRDPQAIPALEAVFSTYSEPAALTLIDVLAQIDGVESATALSRQAVFSPSEAVRSAAAKALHARPYEEFVPLLLSAMFTPVQSKYELYVTPAGRLMYQHAFYREGQDERQSLVFQTSYRRASANPNNDISSLIMAQRFMQRVAEQRERDAAAQNAYFTELNARVGTALAVASDQGLRDNPDAWWDWWNERNEITFTSEKPLNEQIRRTELTSVDIPGAPSTGLSGGRCECLAAGTPIWTELGPVAVEQVQVGDRVLSQDPNSGELTYKPVLRTTVRPAGPLLTLDAGVAGKLHCSGGHVFWVSGQGWLRARKLEPGMLLHTLDGPVELREVKEGPNVETYNLVVADFHSYFTAEGKWLSHDFTPQSATRAVVPGLAAK